MGTALLPKTYVYSRVAVRRGFLKGVLKEGKREDWFTGIALWERLLPFATFYSDESRYRNIKYSRTLIDFFKSFKYTKEGKKRKLHFVMHPGCAIRQPRLHYLFISLLFSTLFRISYFSVRERWKTCWKSRTKKKSLTIPFFFCFLVFADVFANTWDRGKIDRDFEFPLKRFWARKNRRGVP